MNTTYDLIVVGLGIMGAATLWRAASRYSRVLGIDAYGPTHSYGSSQGSSRIFRRAYWEGDNYLPLLNHADPLWNELEKTSQKQLLFRTGGIFIGPPSSRVVAGSVRTAGQGAIEHELWDWSKITTRSPTFNITRGTQALYEPGAYAIAACDARLEMLNEAVKHGASTDFGHRVVHLENEGSDVRVTTNGGRSYLARSVIVTAGPWIADNLLPELKQLIEPRRVPIYWFTPKSGFEKLFAPEHFPIFLYEREDGALLYGVPSIAGNETGVKIGFHNRQHTPAAPDCKAIPVQQQYVTEITSIVESLFPTLERSPIKASNCFYTMSPDESFLIGQSKVLKSTYFASACSGHGFKFAPAIGDALADLAIGQPARVSLSEFSANRFE